MAGDWRSKRVGYVKDYSKQSYEIIDNILEKKTDPVAWKPALMCVNVNGVDIPYTEFITKCN